MLRLVASAALLLAVGGDAKRVRGVGDEGQAAYATEADGSFRCRDGVGTGVLNDDYCDCEDGSDEPGTSACPGSFFYCRNSGHAGRQIFGSLVGDGVCDCCDGSDETQVFCPNTCAAEAEALREAMSGELEELKLGLAQREKFIAQGAERLQEQQQEADEAAAAQAEAEAAVAEAKAAVEREEALEQQERDLRQGVDTAALAVELGLDRLSEQQLRHVVVALARKHEGGSGALHGLLRAELPDLADAELPDVGTEAGDAAGDHKRQEAEDARGTLKLAEQRLRTAKQDVKNAEKSSKHYYGAENEFFALQGECFEHSHQGYNYEVCPYAKAKQGSTSLGTFDKLVDGVMYFKGGQSCWQGPKRSITVSLRCGADTELMEVTEPGKCEYAGVLKTPAACDPKHAEMLGMELS